MDTLQEKIAFAFELIDTGYYLRAETIADRILKSKEPEGQIDALHIKALSLYQSGYLKKSFEVFQRLLKINSEHEDGLYYTALLFSEEGHFLAAQKFVDQLLIKRPDSIPYIELKAEIAFFLGQLDEVLYLYDRILTLQPNSFEILFERADILRKMGQFDDSIQAYQNLLNSQIVIPENEALLLNNIGFNYSLKEDYHRAKGYLEKAYKLDQEHPFILNNLGFVYAQLGNIKSGLNLIEWAIRIDPLNSYAHKNHAKVMLLQGKTKKAHKALLKAQNLNYHLHFDDEVDQLLKNSF